MRVALWVFAAAIAFACSSDVDPVDCEVSGPSISLVQVANASGCSTNDGRIHVALSGGQEPLTLYLNDQPADGLEQINNLAAGVYSVLVKDANHCSATLDNVTILAADFSFTTSIEPNMSCLGGNGSVTVEVTSANPPYSFRLGNGNFTADNFFDGLTTGNHVITAQDNNNCSVSLSVTIPQGSTGTSWSDDIKPIMEKSCAITGCHNGVSRSNDFSEFASVKSFANSIKTKTKDRSMPFDGSLTQNEIDLIACWVNDGALQN
jgi:hypothetical protein